MFAVTKFRFEDHYISIVEHNQLMEELKEPRKRLEEEVEKFGEEEQKFLKK